MKKLYLLALLSLTAINAQGMLGGCRRRTKQVGSTCAKIYKIESYRTAATRTIMAAACLADGAITGGEVSIIALAGASLITATTYNADAKQRCTLLPEKLNLVADGIATIASTDAGWLPITETSAEETLRTGVGIISTLTTILNFFF